MFDTAENKLSILNQIKYKSLYLTSHILWETEAVETMNTLGQILLKGHIVCARYLQRHYFPNAPHNQVEHFTKTDCETKNLNLTKS